MFTTLTINVNSKLFTSICGWFYVWVRAVCITSGIHTQIHTQKTWRKQNHDRSQSKGMFNEIQLDGGRGCWLRPLVPYCEQACILATYKTFAHTQGHTCRLWYQSPILCWAPHSNPLWRADVTGCLWEAFSNTHKHTQNAHTNVVSKCNTSLNI